jgi:hypothetical protein
VVAYPRVPDVISLAGGLYQGRWVKEAIRRYEALWLPLLHRTTPAEARSAMIPPLDVAFVWHVHRLNPIQYELYCKKMFGGIIHPSEHQAFKFTDQHNVANSSSWKAAYGVHEPFYPPSLQVTRGVTRSQPGIKNAYNLEAAVKRQATFCHMLLRGSYQALGFLQQAKMRYSKFLELCRASPGSTVVPMYDIDLMWHTHISLSASYHPDCQRIFGKVGGHQRRQMHRLATSCQSTAS